MLKCSLPHGMRTLLASENEGKSLAFWRGLMTVGKSVVPLATPLGACWPMEFRLVQRHWCLGRAWRGGLCAPLCSLTWTSGWILGRRSEHHTKQFLKKFVCGWLFVLVCSPFRDSTPGAGDRHGELDCMVPRPRQLQFLTSWSRSLGYT